MASNILAHFERPHRISLQDSIIFHVKEGHSKPLFGGLHDGSFGNLKNEIGDGSKGLVFSAACPKSYSLLYQTRTGRIESIVRAKGISLDFVASEILTAQRVSEVVLGSQPVSIPQRNFQRRLAAPIPVRTSYFDKIFQLTNEKRIRLCDNSTRPLGAKQPFETPPRHRPSDVRLGAQMGYPQMCFQAGFTLGSVHSLFCAMNCDY